MEFKVDSERADVFQIDAFVIVAYFDGVLMPLDSLYDSREEAQAILEAMEQPGRALGIVPVHVRLTAKQMSKAIQSNIDHSTKKRRKAKQ